jgi:hypothetical protein
MTVGFKLRPDVCFYSELIQDSCKGLRIGNNLARLCPNYDRLEQDKLFYLSMVSKLSDRQDPEAHF